MKLKTAITAALLAVGVISQASAQNVVYVTGSTAFRATAFAGLNTAGAVFDGAVTLVATRGGSSTSGANYHLFRGNINGADTYINCAWSGSEAGIASAANATIDNDGSPLPGSPETWLKADGTVTGDSRNNPTAGELEASSRGADLAFSDTSQAVSLTPRVPNTATDLKPYGVIGIVTFAWVKNRQTTPSTEWTSLTNITLPQIHSILSQGYQQTALFTGVASHTNNVYLVGRNKGSGTRANELADSGYGTTRTIQQFSIGGGVTTAQTDNLLLEYVGNNGYESGGGVVRALRVDGSCQQADPFFPANNTWFAIGFAGTSDATSTGNGYTLTVAANWLLVDGVLATDGSIEEGAYYFWGRVHLYGKHNISGFQDTTGTKIFNGVQASLGTSGSNPAAHSAGIALQYMHCSKASDVAFPARF